MTGWRVHAWVLMGNHYHLVIETPDANLVAGMKWLQNTYTRRYNTRHRLWGRLFGDRYKAVLVQGDNPHYYPTLLCAWCAWGQSVHMCKSLRLARMHGPTPSLCR